MGLKASALVDAAGDGGHLGHVPADAGPGTVWHRVAARPATSGNLRQWLATRWQLDGRTSLETRPTLQRRATLENAGNAGKCWQRWKKLATLEIAGNAGNR